MKPIHRAALLAAVGALAIAVYWSGASDPPVARPGGGDSTSVAATRAATTPTTTRAATRPPSAKPSAAPAAPVPNSRSPLQASYDTTTNLAALLQAAKAQADAGEAGALRLIAAAEDECYPLRWQKNRGAFRQSAEALGEPQRSIALRHVDFQELRCRDLMAQRSLRPNDLFESLHKATAAGDIVGRTMELEQVWNDTPEAELKQRLRAIVASRDGEAIGLMATMLGPRSEPVDKGPPPGWPEDQAAPQVDGPFAGSQEDYIAWLLVACDLGRDCSENSRLMRQQCLMMTSQCRPGDYREHVRYSLATPRQFDAALVKEKALLGLIASGRYDEIFP